LLFRNDIIAPTLKDSYLLNFTLIILRDKIQVRDRLNAYFSARKRNFLLEIFMHRFLAAITEITATFGQFLLQHYYINAGYAFMFIKVNIDVLVFILKK
jgi:hypothetical protein